MTNIIAYDSTRLQSVLAALAQWEKHPTARLKDTAGLSEGDLTTWIATLDTNTALATYQERIFVDVGILYADGTGSTDDIVFATNPTTGEYFHVYYGLDRITAFEVGATQTIAAVADGLEAGDIGFLNFTVVSNNVDTITITADPALGDSVDGKLLWVDTDSATTTVTPNPGVLAGGVDPVGVVGDFTATHKTALDALLATNPVGYTGDTTATQIIATATKEMALVSWEDLWTNPDPKIVHFLGGYQIAPETRASMTLTITAVGGANTKAIDVTGGTSPTLCSFAGAGTETPAELALLAQQDIIDTVGGIGWIVERDGAVLTVYPPIGQDVAYTDGAYTLGVTNFTATEDGDPFTGGVVNANVAKLTNYATTYMNDLTDAVMLIWKRLTNHSDNLSILPSTYPPIQDEPTFLNAVEEGGIIQDYLDL